MHCEETVSREIQDIVSREDLLLDFRREKQITARYYFVSLCERIHGRQLT